MPWEEQPVVNRREEFVLRALEPGANIAALCREEGISRKTGYKWINRFKEKGRVGLEDLSRRPRNSPLRASGEATLQVIELRQAHPTWGPKKLHAILLRASDLDEVPSVRTIARIIDRAGLVKKRKRRRQPAAPTDAPNAVQAVPNDLWTVDFKGWWRTRDGRRAEPLTVRDGASRYLLCAELMESTAGAAVRPVFERLFQRNGLPTAIQVDNGAPFASTRSRAGLTTLSAWWVSLGIEVIRGRPGHPQDNGGHERMHLDVRYEVEDVPADDLVAQRAALEVFRHEFNEVRPHEALDMAVPADVYVKSTRLYRGSRPTPLRPGLDARKVNRNGYVKFRSRSVYVGTAFAGYSVHLEAIDEESTRAWFYELDLGVVEPR